MPFDLVYFKALLNATEEEDIIDDDLKVLLRKTQKKLESIHNSKTYESLTEEDLIKLRPTIQSRFANYKKHSILKINYTTEDKDFHLLSLSENVYTCPGTSTKNIAVANSCKKHSFIILTSQQKQKLTAWIFDHWYEQNSINKSMTHALNCLLLFEKSENYFAKLPKLKSNAQKIGFLKKNWNKPKMKKILEKYIDLDTFHNDLYGDNIIIRCTECNEANKSPTKHPGVDLHRYLLKSEFFTCRLCDAQEIWD